MGEPARQALNIHDLRALARRRLPKVLFDYLDRGCEDEVGVRRNREALDRLALVPRVLRDVSCVDLATSVLGQPAAMPVGVGATAGAAMFRHEGDVLLARAAKAAGVPFTISGGALTEIERIVEVGGRCWYQFYPEKDRERAYRAVDRAQAAGCEALVLTVDTAGQPNREYNVRNGFAWPVRLTPRVALDAALRPGWSSGVLARNFLEGRLRVPEEKRSLGCDTFTWEELEGLRRRWRGPLLLKGVVSAPDARRAVDLGCDGVIVSNHGGRNLDAAVATIDALPAVLEAVNGRGAVMFDSGVRRGSDVVKALALGAAFVFVGRATLYGLSAAGEPGARRALEILARETRQVMAFCGCVGVDELTPELVAGAV